METARLAAHYFRTQPRMAWRALVVAPIRGVLICPLLGHRQDNVTRLLGLCGRCMAPLLPDCREEWKP